MIALGFVMLPVMVHKLGSARYGLWVLISEVTGYYSYVGLGIRGGVVYYAASYLARKIAPELNRIVTTSVWLLTAVGATLALSGFGLAAAFPSIFASTSLDLQETYWSIVIMAFAVGLSLPIEAMNSTLTAAKRLDIVSIIDVVSRAASSAVMLFFLLRGRGLVSLSVVQLGARILIAPCTYLAIRRTGYNTTVPCGSHF